MAKIPQLSDPQIRALRTMNYKYPDHARWDNSYGWGISLNTLFALESKALIVKAKNSPVILDSKEYWSWRITQKGRALIKEVP